jgi:8-oxo-dGTP pyrophosphatase MutT (NUDIX family)
MSNLIHKSGMLILREGRILLCQKRKKPDEPLILPGGKLEPGETEIECLARELQEELGAVAARSLWKVGTYEDFTADGRRPVRIELYGGDLSGEPQAQAEIGALIWFGKDDDRARISPILRNRIVPDLIARGILPWPP